MKIDTELDVVFVNFLREVVEDLVIAVNPVTRNAAGGTQLSNAAHQNDRHARVERRSSITDCCIGGSAKANGTRMESLICREESFSKPVPAVAKFVNLVRSDGVGI